MAVGFIARRIAWKGAAGLGFLPGKRDAVDDGNCGNHCDHPKCRSHAIKQAAQDEQNKPLGALHEADLAEGNQRLGSRAGVTDHHRARRSHGREDYCAERPVVNRVGRPAGPCTGAMSVITVEGGVEEKAPKAVTRPSRRATCPSSMSRNPARKRTAAAVRNIPVANSAAAQRFTNRPKAVRILGLMLVAAMPPTILSRSQRQAAADGAGDHLQMNII